MADSQATAEQHEHVLQNLRSALGSSCTPLSSSKLLEHADTLRGKTVLITGAGSGIGAAFARFAATLGAEVILSDRNEEAARKVANGILESSVHERAHVAPAASVTDWDQLLSLFEWVDGKFGEIDVVLASAGVTEFDKPGFDMDVLGKDGKLLPPNLATMDVNLKGIYYTTKLAKHYMRKRRVKGSIILMGSLSSFFGIPLGSIYASSKHAVLGFLRSQYYVCAAEGIRISLVAPWFTDTPILALPVRLLLAGLPFCKMTDVVNAITYGATSPDAGGVSLPVDPSGVLALPHEANQQGDQGFDKVFGKRAVVVISTMVSVRDAVLLVGKTAGGGLGLAVIGGGLAYAGWKYLG